MEDMMAHQGEVKSNSWQIEVLYDGACPICSREMRMIMRRDRTRRIQCVDITSEQFNPEAFGLDAKSVMDRIHARLPNGEIIVGVEVFRRIYDALGFGWLVRFSRFPGITQLLDIAYEIFAKNRLRLTGRCEAAACAASDKKITGA